MNVATPTTETQLCSESFFPGNYTAGILAYLRDLSGDSRDLVGVAEVVDRLLDVLAAMPETPIDGDAIGILLRRTKVGGCLSSGDGG
jgi:hypothetical protein